MRPMSSGQLLHAPTLDSLGRYELLSLLAKGGMGEVYLGRMRGPAGFQKLVVIKRNIPSADEEVRSQMLYAEARLVATLSHANIVQVYDVGHEGETVFLAMEFLHGQDLRTVIKRTWGAAAPLPLDCAIASALAVCSGLHYAHDKRDADGAALEIVHRDVSPSNVFVTYDGAIKLIDFGIAKATSLPSDTKLGTIKGKPGYMSPEQCNGESLDRRSDVFCVGILLYELTTGRSPFRNDTEYKTLHAILERDPPRPSSFDASYPIGLEAIVMRALAKDRRQRYQTAAALQDDLAALVRELRLDVSQYQIGRFMAALFADELIAWRQAQGAGESLEDFVVKRTTGTTPALPSRLVEQRLSIVAASSGELAQATVDDKPSARRRRLPIAALLASVGVIGAVIALVIGMGTRTDATSAATPAPAPAPVVTTPPTRPEPASTARPEPASTAPPEPASTARPEPASTAPPEARASGQLTSSEKPTPRATKPTTHRAKRKPRTSPADSANDSATIDPDGVW